MNKVLIFGHKNPDTDTICSAIAAKHIFKDEFECEAYRLGEISDETKFALDYANVTYPELLKNVSEDNVILVDHNEFNQSVDNIESANILKVIDHHRISNFKTDSPIYMNVQPVGCTATILLEIAKSKNITLTKEIAILLISAIISDSLLFKSPTCTQRDIDACHELNEIANLNIDEYGMNLLKAGMDFSKFDAKHIINIDSKEFKTDNGSFRVAQVTTLNVNETLLNYEQSFKKELKNQVDYNNYDLSILLITDILECDSLAIVIGNKQEFFNKQFNVTLNDDKALLKEVVSRKKQVVPFL